MTPLVLSDWPQGFRSVLSALAGIRGDFQPELNSGNAQTNPAPPREGPLPHAYLAGYFAAFARSPLQIAAPSTG